MKPLLSLLLIFSLSFSLSFAAESEEEKLKKMIGSMLIVGFKGSKINRNAKIIKLINRYNLGGVILFDTPKKDANVKNPKQLKRLTSNLKRFSNHKILICIDEEGGRVSRLKSKNGFFQIPSAKKVGEKNDETYSQKIYASLAKELSRYGINCNFAPVVDLAINPENEVIVKQQRSFSKDPLIVAKEAEIFVKEMKKRKILSVLKHFPGHGSSFEDTHKDFTDVTESWSEKELIPYRILINKNLAFAIMTAHIYNAHLDKNYPATLSYETVTYLLRKKLGFKGIVISDDMEMGAIKKYYSLDKALILAINSGMDMLLFANRQKSKTDIKQIIDIIYKNVKKGKIGVEKIEKANKRIKNILNQFL